MGVAGWYEKGINLELRSMIYEQTRLRYGDDRRGRRRVMTELSPGTSPDPAEPDSPDPRSNLLKVDRPMTRSEVKELWGDAYNEEYAKLFRCVSTHRLWPDRSASQSRMPSAALRISGESRIRSRDGAGAFERSLLQPDHQLLAITDATSSTGAGLDYGNR